MWQFSTMLKKYIYKETLDKINTQKSLAFLNTNNEKTEREIKERISFTTATKKKQKTYTQKTIKH